MGRWHFKAYYSDNRGKSVKSQFERYELKYNLPEGLYPDLMRLIKPYMALDPHLEHTGKKKYLVRSLYLDTDDLRFYGEKKAGISHRKKLRIRAYNQDHSEVFLEVKQKKQDFVLKDRAHIYYDELHTILNQYGGYKPNGNGDRTNNDVVKYYLSLIPVLQLRPVVLITYEREAYRGLFDEGARLTLDRNLCCLPGRSYDLFYSGRNWFNVNNSCILELKFNNIMPFFFKRIIERLDLWVSSISKYCLCVERIKPLL